ncbi:MAG: SPOR domain-containing protein [Bacteroidota bacterium]|nr:SPOR domain-containing protein [Bacteroidota bacterium]
MINQYRKDNGLPELALSVSLSFVATAHVADLVNNHPDTGICNLNSWSDQGNWISCCHNSYVPKSDCILNKPRELTEYRGEGHELAYWEPMLVIPDSVMHFWASIRESSDFLLNKDKWSKYKWRSLGVGMLKGYAVIWVGELTDRAGKPGICVKEREAVIAPSAASTIALITEESNRYYVICASYEVEKDAMTDAKALSGKGYPGTKVVRGDQNYRVSLGDFQSLGDAKAFKSKLGEQFRNVWILQF